MLVARRFVLDRAPDLGQLSGPSMTSSCPSRVILALPLLSVLTSKLWIPLFPWLLPVPFHSLFPYNELFTLTLPSLNGWTGVRSLGVPSGLGPAYALGLPKFASVTPFKSST